MKKLMNFQDIVVIIIFKREMVIKLNKKVLKEDWLKVKLFQKNQRSHHNKSLEKKILKR